MNQEEKGNQKGRENKKQKQEEFTTAKMGLTNKDENPETGWTHMWECSIAPRPATNTLVKHTLERVYST